MKRKTTLITGAKGMVGSAIFRKLCKKDSQTILTPHRKDLDYTERDQVFRYFEEVKPSHVFLASAKVGGIIANSTYPVDFLLENLKMQNNIMEAAFEFKTDKLLFLGSSCIYPKYAKQPILEDSLLTAPLEPTNEPYALAKIAGIKLCQSYRTQYGCNFISAMPTNLYGTNDNYHPEHSHVIPGLIRRMHEAKLRDDSEFFVWGSGKAQREFLHCDDLADACVFLMEKYNETEPINVGSPDELTIKELAFTIQEIVEFQGDLVFDSSKPDGTPRKKLNTQKLEQLGWYPKINILDGLKLSYEEFLKGLKSNTLRSK